MYTCPACGARRKSMRTLKYHYRRYHYNYCFACMRRFKDAVGLARHASLHEDPLHALVAYFTKGRGSRRRLAALRRASAVSPSS